jgi:osmotically-inducible protein OsmY
VTLYGDVNTQYEKEDATDVASLVLGVREVINKIAVSAVPRYGDISPKERIKTRLSSNWVPELEADPIKVNVENGMATLAGEVETWSQ